MKKIHAKLSWAWNAHKYKNDIKFSCFQAQISLECYFPVKNVKMLHYSIYDQEKFHAYLSWARIFYNLGNDTSLSLLLNKY